VLAVSRREKNLGLGAGALRRVFRAEHAALDEHGSAVSYIAGDGVAVEFGASDMRRVAFTEWIRSRRESTRVPSRSKMSSADAVGVEGRR